MQERTDSFVDKAILTAEEMLREQGVEVTTARNRHERRVLAAGGRIETETAWDSKNKKPRGENVRVRSKARHRGRR